MPNRFYVGKAKRESNFSGNSEELEEYLERKRTSLKFLLKNTKNKEQMQRIKDFVDKIDDVLSLDYFYECDVMSMSELVKKIKNDRAELTIELKRLKPQLDKAENELRKIFEVAGRHMASVYEDEYDTRVQEKLRELYDDYDAIKLEYESYEDPLRVRWWLLGMISRPVGFFSKVIPR